MRWIFFHGWGFSAECFNHFRSAHCFDRGYFGSPCSIDPSLFEEEHTVVAHSFGLHFVPPGVKKVVVIGGFTHLNAAVLRMRLENNPNRALEQFYQRCGMQKRPEGPLNLPLLRSDLGRIEQRLDVSRFQHIEVDIFHGTEDLIVPVEKGLELHRLLPKSRFHLIEGGSHASILYTALPPQDRFRKRRSSP